MPVRELSTNLAQTPKIVYLIGVEGTAPHHTPNPFYSPFMRKIEAPMIAAINNGKDWQSANTSVHFNEENEVSVVRFHGNKIAEVGDDFVQIFDGGWQTNTTKSRLNVIINEFCNAVTDGVFQKDFQWYIRDNNVVRDFDNGYIFAWYIMLKKTVIRVVGETANGIDSKMTRLEKFEVFCRVCDNLLDDGRITKAQHSSWTNIF